MRNFMIMIRVGFLAAALTVLISGISWWLFTRPALATATAIKNLSPLSYQGPAPVSTTIAKTLSSYHFKDQKVGEEEHKLFTNFNAAEEKGNKPLMREVLKSMSNSYKNAGETEMAVLISNQALQLNRKDHHKKDAAGNLQDIADIYHAANNLDKSDEYDKQAASAYEKIDAQVELASVLKHLAGNYKQQGKLEEMNKVLKRANKIMATLHPRIEKHAAQLAKQISHSEGLDGSEESSVTAGNKKKQDKDKSDKSDAQSIKATIDAGAETNPGEDET